MGRFSPWTNMVILSVAVLIASAAGAQAQANGVVFITSDPTGVEVLMDGESVGKTPVTVSGVKPGLHTVATRTKDMVDDESTVTVAAGEVTSVSFSLEPATGSLRLVSDMVGLQISLDGVYVGDVAAGQAFTADGLMVGPHIIRLTGPFVETEQSFSIDKNDTAEATINGASRAGSLSVSSTIPANGLTVDGIQVAQGAAPYRVANLAPGQYIINVLTEPVPYLTKVAVTAGGASEINLDASRDLGRIIVSAPVEGEGEVEVTIDGVLVAQQLPASIDGVVKGPHTIEVSGIPSGLPSHSIFTELVSARESFWVTPGGTTAIDFSSDELSDGNPPCPEGMVRVAPSIVKGEFWFEHESHGDSSAASVGTAVPATRGQEITFSAPGTSITLSSVDSGPVQNGQKRDATTGKLLYETESFLAKTIENTYCIDIYEYPNRRGEEPTLMGYFDAAATCAEEGKRLCTSAEWVAACVGPENHDYPYGTTHQPARCNTLDNPRSRGLAAAGSFADCVNGYGLYDMSGNAAEWTVAEVQYDWVSAPVDPGPMSMTERRLVYSDVARHVRRFTEFSSSPKIDLRGGSWMSEGWDTSCRAMPALIGSYIAAETESGQAAAGGGMMGGPGMMGSGGPGMMAGPGMMSGPGMMGSGGSGMMGGSAAGMGGGAAAAGPSQAGQASTVTRGSGPDARYLGSARLRGFRCCAYTHGVNVEDDGGPLGAGGSGSGAGTLLGGMVGE